MPMNVAKELAVLKRMTTTELRQKYAEVFGETSRSGNKQWLIKRIIWRMQANAEGGLSERALRRAMELANDGDLRLKAPVSPKPATAPVQRTVVRSVKPVNGRLPMPGTVLTRDYKGTELRVTVLANSFEFEGEVYKSLSAVAKAVTGQHWNGYYFFGLQTTGTSR